jgi:hypothetical protein
MFWVGFGVGATVILFYVLIIGLMRAASKQPPVPPTGPHRKV